MDSNLIYIKTTSGEEAMHQRTRVMQRNLRMVLILVDGKSTVADLVSKIGNPQLTEASLLELEEGGFIAPHVAPDSLWSESKKVAQEIRDAALSKATQIVSPEKESVVPPPPNQALGISPDSAFSKSAFPFPPMPFANDEGQRPPLVSEKPGVPRKPGASMSEVFAKLGKRLAGVFAGGEPLDQPAVSIKPIRRGERRNSLTWSACLTLAFLFLIVLAVLTVIFFPFGIFRPEIEAAMAQATGLPMTIGDIRGEIYPKPGLFLTDVKIGNEKTTVSIPEIRLLPDVETVFEPKIKYRQVVLSGVSFPAELIGGLPGIFAAFAAPTSRFAVAALRFEKTAVSFAGLALSDLAGEAKLDASGSFQSVYLQSSDRAINLDAKPVGARVELNLDAFSWRPSEGSRFLVNTASLKGVLESGVLTLQDVELHIFDGVVKGSAVFGADKSFGLTGEIDYERINATRLGEALGIGQLLAGDVGGTLRFSAHSESWSSIFSAMDADGDFSLSRGEIRGVDLPEAVRRVSRGPVQGGATQFERLTGRLQATASGYQISGINMNSGLMQSTGNVEVGKDLKLKGRIELQIRGSANQMRVPVLLGGTLLAPEVRAGNN